ncbi:hypothetical protein YPPY66_1005, partial [Yersinia pestis PY-66]
MRYYPSGWLAFWHSY